MISIYGKLRSPDLRFRLIFLVFLFTHPTSVSALHASAIVICIATRTRYVGSVASLILRTRIRYRPLSVIQHCDPEPARYLYFISATALCHTINSLAQSTTAYSSVCTSSDFSLYPGSSIFTVFFFAVVPPPAFYDCLMISFSIYHVSISSSDFSLASSISFWFYCGDGVKHLRRLTPTN